MLYAIAVPRRAGKPLGGTEFANMHAAHENRRRHQAAARGDHRAARFREVLGQDADKPGSKRAPLTAEQRRKKPPVSHPIFLTHPITGRRVLYANPGYAIRINELPQAESDELLELLFTHQLQDKFRHVHQWTEGDVLMWDNIGTVHYARPDYGPDEHRLMKRCQVMADRVFDRDFAGRAIFA